MFISTSVLASNQGIKITVEGVNLQTDVSPVSLNGRVMVPVRIIGESFGSDVKWDGKTKTVIIVDKVKPKFDGKDIYN